MCRAHRRGLRHYWRRGPRLHRANSSDSSVTVVSVPESGLHHTSVYPRLGWPFILLPGWSDTGIRSAAASTFVSQFVRARTRRCGVASQPLATARLPYPHYIPRTALVLPRRTGGKPLRQRAYYYFVFLMSCVAVRCAFRTTNKNHFQSKFVVYVRVLDNLPEKLCLCYVFI
ncbi:hypothetical protein K439DRAFT_1117613 [Ramaria rubella]|nr:hypothetical protein K439DRAFT_1117613 [Ramaria rubella]